MSSSFSVTGHYGKIKVRVAKVVKRPDRHEIHEFTVTTLLEGAALETSYTLGSNKLVIPTDTQKNTCYAIAKLTNFDCAEEYGIALARHFLKRHAHIDKATIHLVNHIWTRMVVDGRPHHHGFLQNSPEVRTCKVEATRGGSDDGLSFVVSSGIDNMVVIKTTQSGFEDYVRDEYTTLKETKDRIVCTSVKAEWSYKGGKAPGRYNQIYNSVRESIVKEFAGPADTGIYSPSVQETEYKAVVRSMQTCAEISKMTISMPNIHYIPFPLQQFGMENNNEIFYPTCEPSGFIVCNVARKETSKL